MEFDRSHVIFLKIYFVSVDSIDEDLQLSDYRFSFDIFHFIVVRTTKVIVPFSFNVLC